MSRFVWQADFYRCPLRNEAGMSLWELNVCDRDGKFVFSALCPQSQANISWLVETLPRACPGTLPDLIEVFRPQSFGLIEAAAKKLGIPVQATRYTDTLKQWLQEKATYYSEVPNYTGEAFNPLALDQPPPMPLPEQLWGDRWRFATLPAGELAAAFRDRPIPVLQMPDFLLPLNLGVPSSLPVPGVIIDGGKQSLRLARWFAEQNPVSINYVAGDPSGLVLEAGLVERWIVATFADTEVAAAAQTYEQRKQLSQGLHFLLIQPDDSGMTYSGFWLLRSPKN